MIRRWLLAALLACGWCAGAWADRSVNELTDANVETPSDFRDWTKDRVETLREDMDALDRRLNDYGADRKDRASKQLSELRERVSRVEGRVQELGDETNRDAWKSREKIREEIKDVREDFYDVRRDLRRR